MSSSHVFHGSRVATIVIITGDWLIFFENIEALTFEEQANVIVENEIDYHRRRRHHHDDDHGLLASHFVDDDHD